MDVFSCVDDIGSGFLRLADRHSLLCEPCFFKGQDRVRTLRDRSPCHEMGGRPRRYRAVGDVSRRYIVRDPQRHRLLFGRLSCILRPESVAVVGRTVKGRNIRLCQDLPGQNSSRTILQRDFLRIHRSCLLKKDISHYFIITVFEHISLSLSGFSLSGPE